MNKRFFYAASVHGDNTDEMQMSGLVDTKDPISVENLITHIKTNLESKGIVNASVHISQLNYLMDIPDNA